MFIKMSGFPKITPNLDTTLTGLDNGKNVQVLLSKLISLINNNIVSGLKGAATTATVPGVSSNGNYYVATGAGTYTNFLDSGGNPIVVNASDTFAYLVYNGTYWTKVAGTLTLTDYVTKVAATDAINNSVTEGLFNNSIKYLFQSTGYAMYAYQTAAITPYITQSVDVNGLKLTPTGTVDGEVSVVDGGILFDLTKSNKLTLTSIISAFASANPAVTLGYGNNSAIKHVAFRSDGSILTFNGGTTATVLQAATPANAFTSSATVKIEISYNGSVMSVRCWNGSVWSSTYTLTGFTFATNVIFGMRGRLTSVNNISVAINSADKIYTDSASAALQTQIDTITYGGPTSKLAATPYTTAATNGASPAVIASTIIQTAQSQGLKAEILAGVSGYVQYLDTGIAWDATKHVRILTKISSITGTPCVGAGYGDPASGTMKGSLYRSSGQVFGLTWSSASLLLSGWTTGRAANALYAYVVNDVVELDFDLPNLKLITKVNGVIHPGIALDAIPTGNIKLLFRDVVSISETKVVISSSVSSVTPTNVVYYVNKATGSDSNNGGSPTSPFLTIGKAISSCANKNAKILVYAGDYREVLDFTPFTGENIELIAVGANKVRVLGSDAVTGWSKTAGRTNIYQAAFAGSVPAWTREANPIFEDGNPSMPIAANEIHPLQKGLTNRLPYTLIKLITAGADLAATLTSLDTSPGKYYVSGGIIYINTSNSSNPATNGFSYEVITRNFNTTLATANLGIALPNLTMRRMNFCFGLTGFTALGFNVVTRYNCSALAAITAGCWRDDSATVISYKDEAGGSDNDGFNGHYTYTDFLTQDVRTGNTLCVYHDMWSHDNYDDGISHHERHEVSIYGALTEYNGDSGMRPSTGCNYRVYNGHMRKNGWEVNKSGSAAANGGEGIATVNPVLDGRAATNAICFNCVSEGNNVGYSANSDALNKLTLINCVSRNNISAELYSHLGNITSRNTLATNSNSALLKVTASGGTITIVNDPLLT